MAAAAAAAGAAATGVAAGAVGASPGVNAASSNQPPGLGSPLNADIHHGIARDIGQQVEMMILEAKHKSESTVSKEIVKIKSKMENMMKKIKTITERVNRLDNTNGSLLKADLQKSIAKLEEVWEGEVGTLKHELWQTIQAHNHNADLLKHHKTAIDQIQSRASESHPNPELELIHQQLTQVDSVMKREQAKEQQLDQLMMRLSMVQQQLAHAGGGWAPQAVPYNPQGNQNKKQQKRNPGSGKSKAKAAPAPQVPTPGLRAEAPEFVPTTAGWPDGSG